MDQVQRNNKSLKVTLARKSSKFL